MKSKTSKLGICQTWVKLFVQNEKNFKSKDFKKILTDEKITEIIIKDFPSHHESEIFRQPNRARNRYNRGQFTGGKVPKTKSYRYLKHASKVVRVERRTKSGQKQRTR